MKYKAIIVDLFGTLVKNLLSHQYQEMLVEIANTLIIEQRRFMDVWLGYSDDRMTGKMSNADCLSLVCHETGLEPSEEMFRNCLNVFTDQVKSRLEPAGSTLTVLSNLRERGYIIGLISNYSDGVSYLWESSSLSSVIHEPVFSCSVGVKKPDPQIYLITAKTIGVNSQECIFVDDSVEYLDGAREVGMTGVLIQDRRLNSSFSKSDDWDGYKIFSISEIETLLNIVE